MIQKHKPAGAIIVSTPQDLALIDAARAIDLFNQSTVPIIGLVENMAGYQCPKCGEISDPFDMEAPKPRQSKWVMRSSGAFRSTLRSAAPLTMARRQPLAMALRQPHSMQSHKA